MATIEVLDPPATSMLQPEDSNTSGSADMTDTSTPSSTPPSLTHNTSRARFHIKDLSSFATCLENSAKRAFPTRGRSCSRYKSVQVLLLMWEDDELGVDNELDGLHQIFRSYGFDTETWLIPLDNAHLKLMLKAASFVEKYESENCLLIVYYGGHAAINSARQSSWYCKSDPEFASISLEWSAIQTVFEKATSDVLLLLDCCFAASAAPIAGRAITETIAACGWESIAPAPGRWSFTSALIEVLDEWIDHSFSVAMLHCKVLSVLKHEQPERRGQKKRKVECRRTPVYIHTSAEPDTPSINLSRLRSKESSEDKNIFSAQAGSDGQVSFEAENPQSNPDIYSLDDLTSSGRTGDLKVPHVLISIALCEDQELELKACSDWLAAFPALAKYATVKGVYRSHSTLVIASVPVVIWDLLPENRACSFIGYVTSDNLLDRRETSNRPITSACSQAISVGEGSKTEKHRRMMSPLNSPVKKNTQHVITKMDVESAHPVKMEPSDALEAYSTSTRILPSEVLESKIGPVIVPRRLDPPKDGFESLKRKASDMSPQQAKDPKAARLEAYMTEFWKAAYAKLGEPPSLPAKISANPYILYEKDNFEAACRKCEEGRRRGKGKCLTDEVRIMLAKMWEEASDAEKKPYNDQAALQEEVYAAALTDYTTKTIKWDLDALAFRREYEAAYPSPPDPDQNDPWDTPSKGTRQAKKFRRDEAAYPSLPCPDEKDPWDTLLKGDRKAKKFRPEDEAAYPGLPSLDKKDPWDTLSKGDRIEKKLRPEYEVVNPSLPGRDEKDPWDTPSKGDPKANIFSRYAEDSESRFKEWDV